MALWFYPSASLALDQLKLIEHQLADSINYLAEQNLIPPELASSIASPGEGRLHPLVFAGYYKLVLAIKSGDEGACTDITSRLIQLVKPGALRPTSLNISHFEPNDAVRGWMGDWYSSIFDHDVERPLGLQKPADSAEFEALLDNALKHIEVLIPDVFNELCATVSQIIIADSQPRGCFEGASALSMYGAILLNCTVEHDLLSLIEALIHETAHNLLHGFTLLEPLHNHMDDRNRYSSPLRPDARPIEGIFHACFVIAKMHYTLAQIGENKFSPFDGTVIEERLETLRQQFVAGMSVINQHASLTEAGKCLMNHCSGYLAN
jgi:HEXXH motif-containing protein